MKGQNYVPYRYQVFGLSIDSDLEFSELPLRLGSNPDVKIHAGIVPTNLENVEKRGKQFQINRDQCLFFYPKIGSFLVNGGNELVYSILQDADLDIVRLILMGPLLSDLLLRRGMILLHASAVLVEGQAWLFAGPSGVGKSTTAAILAGDGQKLISDDVSVIQFSQDEVPQVYESSPGIKLWEDSFQHLIGSLPVIKKKLVGKKLDTYEKHVYIFDKQISPSAYPISKIFFLGVGDLIEITEIKGGAKLAHLKSNIYGYESFPAYFSDPNIFSNLISISNRCQLYWATHNDDLENLIEFRELIKNLE